MPGPIDFYCSCGYQLFCPADMAGRSITCPQCSAAVRVPQGDPGGVARLPGSTPTARAGSTRSCPFCAEQIQEAARKCRFCGEMLDATPPPPVRPRPGRRNLRRGESGKESMILGILSLFCCGVILGPLAIVKGIEGRDQEGQEGMAIAGIACGAIGTCLSVVGIIFQVVFDGKF